METNVTDHLRTTAENWILRNPQDAVEARRWASEFIERPYLYEKQTQTQQAQRLENYIESRLCLYTRSLPALTLSSPRFNPVELDVRFISVGASADVWKTRFKAILPPDARAAMDSKSPQEPLVFITKGRASFFPNITAMFLHYESDCDEGRATLYESGEGLGQDILAHVSAGWSGTGDDGRPNGWDEKYQPSCKVLTFSAFSPVHAYIRVITAIADGGTWEDVSGAGCVLTPWKEMKPEEGVDPDDHDDDSLVDYTTNTLFIHVSEDEKIYVAVVKLRDLIDDARQWVMATTI